MFIRPFLFERAERLTDACELLRQHGEDAKVIAGGQSLMPMINLGLVRPDVVIDISRATGERDLTSADGYLRAGALVTHARLAADPLVRQAQPLLSTAASRIGNSRVRSRGTLGGSLAHSDPAAELPVVMMALGASYELADGRGTREVRAEDFHVTFLTTALNPDEVVLSVRLPVLGPEWGWSFLEMSRRHGDFAIAAVAALVRLAGGVVVESRVAVGGVSDRAIRLADVETRLTGAAPDQIGRRVGELQGIQPLSDAAASDTYRAELARVLVIRALTEASQRSADAA
jgi:aerobic carbon-monoxide dehydrogenase medium subunit